MPVTGTPVVVGDGYCTAAYIELRRGERNVIEWSNKDNNAETVDAEVVAAAIETGKAMIDQKLKGNYTLPIDLDEDDAGRIILRRWNEVLASYELFAARGMRDDNPAGNDLTKERDEVLAEIATYAGDSPSATFDFEAVEAYVPMAPLVVL
jgi:phage gp36-like protein